MSNSWAGYNFQIYLTDDTEYCSNALARKMVGHNFAGHNLAAFFVWVKLYPFTGSR